MDSPRAAQFARYSDLFYKLLDGVVLVDPETYLILDANDAFEKMSGESTIGKSIIDWVPAEQRDHYSKMLRVTRRRYFAQTWDNHWITTSSRLEVKTVACMLALSNGRHVIQILVRDVTLERQAEAKIRKYVQELQIANSRLEALSTIDDLTQLCNVRQFKERLSMEHARAERYASQYALVFIDADNFKHYNDRNGHPAGDQLLKQLGQIIKSSCRTTDLAARYGGEEFIVLCPETGHPDAIVVAERIRRAVESFPFAHASEQPLGKVSVSIGVACYPAHGSTSDEILESADTALYTSKQQGRNRVTSAKDVTTSKLKKPA